jgi:hypothetical protein
LKLDSEPTKPEIEEAPTPPLAAIVPQATPAPTENGKPSATAKALFNVAEGNVITMSSLFPGNLRILFIYK